MSVKEFLVIQCLYDVAACLTYMVWSRIDVLYEVPWYILQLGGSTLNIYH